MFSVLAGELLLVMEQAPMTVSEQPTAMVFRMFILLVLEEFGSDSFGTDLDRISVLATSLLKHGAVPPEDPNPLHSQRELRR